MRFLHIFFISVSLIGLEGCLSCDDCDGYVPEPTVNFKFIDNDSLVQITGQLGVLDSVIDSAQTIQSDLEVILINLGDSLEIIEDSIANGGDLENEKLLVELAITYADSVENEIEIVVDSLSIEHEAYSVLKEEVLSGIIYMDTIYNLLNDQYIIQEDSAIRTYPVPLNYNDTTSAIGFTINSRRYAIELKHDNMIEVDLRGNALITYSNIDTIANTSNFEKIAIECTSKACKAYETTFICYF